MCCGSSDTSFFCAACSRAWACSSRSRCSIYSLFHATFLLSNSSISAILCTLLGRFGGGFSCCQRSTSSRTPRTFFSASLSSSMAARISTSFCAGPLSIGPPLVTRGVGHLTPPVLVPLLLGHPCARGVLVSVLWTRAVRPKRPQGRVNVRRGEVSGRGEVPGVGADLDGEGGAVTKVENHGLRSVHPPARLDLPVLYGRYRFSDGLKNRLQFVLGAGWADYLGVFSATRVLAVHPCSFGFLLTTSTFRHSASYPCLAVSPRPGTSSRLWREENPRRGCSSGGTSDGDHPGPKYSQPIRTGAAGRE